jgi:hypothetical protein
LPILDSGILAVPNIQKIVFNNQADLEVCHPLGNFNEDSCDISDIRDLYIFTFKFKSSA